MAAEPARQCATLSQYCHRVVAKNIDFLHDVGDVPYRVLKPVLDVCSAQSLLRLERKAPHIALEDEEVWRALCLREFPALELDDDGEPDSWRDYYHELKEDAESRIEQAASRMRSLREEERAHKRARQIVVTDKQPPTRRARGGAPRPKTLFEKTRKEAQKASKAHVGSSMPVPQPPRSATIAFEPRRPSSSTVVTHAGPSSSTVSATRPQDASHPGPVRPISSSPPVQRQGPPPAPKNPAASLFMPKHRAYSQRPQATK